MRRVTLDTNVYISALNFGGQPKRLLDMAIAGEIDVAISDAILEEIERVLRTKFNWEPDEIRETEALIRSIAKHVDPNVRLDVVPDDPDDNRIVECAVEAGSEAIITHDKDLLRIKRHQRIKILRVGEFLRQAPERER